MSGNLAIIILQQYRRRLKRNEIVGCSKAEIKSIMSGQEVDKLPQPYYEYLRVFGKNDGGLFRGLDASYPALCEIKWGLDAEIKIASKPPLPEDAFVFLSHQGHTYYYFCVNEAPDYPVYVYGDSYESPKLMKPLVE